MRCYSDRSKGLLIWPSEERWWPLLREQQITNLYHKSTTESIRPQKSPKRLQLENLYGKIRAIRETKTPPSASLLADIFASLSKEHAGDWLLALEILELAKEEDLKADILAYFEELIRQKPSVAHLRACLEVAIRPKAQPDYLTYLSSL